MIRELRYSSFSKLDHPTLEVISALLQKTVSNIVMDSSTYSSILVTPTTIIIRAITSPSDSLLKPCTSSPIRKRSRTLTSSPIKDEPVPLPRFKRRRSPSSSDISGILSQSCEELLGSLLSINRTSQPSSPTLPSNFRNLVDAGLYTTVLPTDEQKPADVCSLNQQAVKQFYNPRIELLYNPLSQQNSVSNHHHKRRRTTSATSRNLTTDPTKSFRSRRRNKTGPYTFKSTSKLASFCRDFGLDTKSVKDWFTRENNNSL